MRDVSSSADHCEQATLTTPPLGWRFGNVHWRAMVMLAVPGFVGAFVGAVLLSSIDARLAAPWVAVILSVLGGLIFARTVFGRSPAIRLYSPRVRTMGPLGAVGGFIDSIGGGGWGPVTTSTLMAANRMPPNQVIGTVSAAEFVVAIGSSIGFLLALGTAGVAWDAMATLLLGGVIAAPIAAWLVSRLDHRVLGALVGGMILFTNADRVLGLVGVHGNGAMVVRVLIVVATILTCAMAIRRQQQSRDDVRSAGLDLAA